MKKTTPFEARESRPQFYSEASYAEGSAKQFGEKSLAKKSQYSLQKRIAALEAERDACENFVAMLVHDLRTPLTAARLQFGRNCFESDR